MILLSYRAVLKKIGNYITIVIVGILCSQVFQDQSIVFVVTLAVGMVLFREPPMVKGSEKRNVGEGKPKTGKSKRSPLYSTCIVCGKRIKKNANFCVYCGAPQKKIDEKGSALKSYDSRAILGEFRNLRKLYEMGVVDEDRYNSIIRDTVMVDDSNNYWYVSLDTSNWYRNVDGSWLLDQPSGRLRITSRSGFY